MELGCIYEGGNKVNTIEVSTHVVDANVNFRETYSNDSSKHYLAYDSFKTIAYYNLFSN